MNLKYGLWNIKWKCLFATTALTLLSFLWSSGQWLPGHEFVGKWVRSDGTYQLVIESVLNDGTAKVKYLNPQPINVESATIKYEKKLIILTVVLRDEGYPGSTYVLFHHPDEKMLVGSYMMPGQNNQRFDVSFLPAEEDKKK